MDAGIPPYERERLCQLIGAPEQEDEAATSKGKSDARTENPNAKYDNQILKIGNPNAKRGE